MSNDVYFSLFIYRSYENYQIGTFVLYRSSFWPFEVHVRQWECGSVVQAAACVCGFVVRDGSDVIAFDMCSGEMGETKPHLSVKNRDLSKSAIRITESYQGRKVTVSDSESDYFKNSRQQHEYIIQFIKYLNFDNESNIYWKHSLLLYNVLSVFMWWFWIFDLSQMTFSSGAFVRADVSDWGMSLTLRAPSSDRSHTEGLCGTYDGQPDNDFHSAGGATLEDQHAFISEWRSEFYRVTYLSVDMKGLAAAARSGSHFQRW